MLIPAEITIGAGKFPTLVIVAMFGFLYWLFILWYEGRKDGFESEKILDLAFISTISSAATFFIVSLIYRQLTVFHPDSFLLKLDYELTVSLFCFISTLIPIFVVSRVWKWSKFRLFDIYAMAFSLFLFLYGLGKFLVYLDINFLIFSVFSIVLYLEVLRLRGYRFQSGTMFSIFLVFLTLCGIILFRRSGYLLIYGILFTMSIVNLLSRRKISMNQRNLPAELITALKNKLLNKDKQLRESQQLLIKEDPYLQEGRDTGNAEEMDEAVLEDTRKEISDAELGIIKRLRIQIKRALATIKLGRYGTCETCGNPIDKARLQAYPEATTCIDCASKVAQSQNE